MRRRGNGYIFFFFGRAMRALRGVLRGIIPLSRGSKGTASPWRYSSSTVSKAKTVV